MNDIITDALVIYISQRWVTVYEVFFFTYKMMKGTLTIFVDVKKI